MVQATYRRISEVWNAYLKVTIAATIYSYRTTLAVLVMFTMRVYLNVTTYVNAYSLTVAYLHIHKAARTTVTEPSVYATANLPICEYANVNMQPSKQNT